MSLEKELIKLPRSKTCSGCGVKLTDENEGGFTLDLKNKKKDCYCIKCHDLL